MPRQERQHSATDIYHVMLKGINRHDIFEEGYCQAESYVNNSSQDVFTFCYYDRDHLGNIRQVTEADGSSTGSVIQTMNYYPFGAEFCDGSANSSVQSYKYNGKELDLMHGLNTYDYGARQYFSILGRWDRMDPLCEKYYSLSPYNYCNDNPINAIDIEGERGIRIVNIQNQTVTIKATYFVETGNRIYHSLITKEKASMEQYSYSEIESMQEGINSYLNDLNLIISKGKYSGYKIKFDLTFKSSEAYLSSTYANEERYGEFIIGNSIIRSSEDMIDRFMTKEENGIEMTRGGFTQNKETILMNIKYDNQENRIHEIFHTLGFNHPNGKGGGKGIMHYPPLKPDKDDANTLMYNSYLPTIEE